MWFKKPRAPKTHQTPFGEFIQKNGVWEGDIEMPDEEVRITTDDVNGEPNPRLLHIIPLIQRNLFQFESLARQNVEDLSPQYYLESVAISNLHPDTDFTLNFSYSEEEEPAMACVVVAFKDEKITGWWGWD